MKLENARQQATTAGSAHADAVKQLKTHTSRVGELEKMLASASNNLKSTESELRLLQSKHSDIERQLASSRTQQESLQRELSKHSSQMQEYEDRVLRADRELSARQRELDTLGERLESEMAKRMQLEQSKKAVQSEIDGLQMRMVEQDQCVKGLRRELHDKESELQKSLSLQDKTIVEHVHVLEEAKRYTDKQLAECVPVCLPFSSLLTLS